MSSSRIRALTRVMVAVAFVVSPVARAETDRSPDTLALVAHVAPIGGPFGLVGGSVDVSPARWVSVEIGGGAGLFGPQLALLARGRVTIDEAWAFSLGGGPSFGRFRPSFFQVSGKPSCGGDCQSESTPTFPRALWLDVAASLEMRTRGPLTLRLSAGVSRMLNPSRCQEVPASCEYVLNHQGEFPGPVNLPFVDLALGGFLF